MSKAKAQKPVVEDRRFQMNEKLLIDTIKRQAGTLAKAILEGVMNAVDAKATECRIALSETDLEVVDNGKGMSEDEVRRLFEVFGAPHTPEEGKVYGTFRMGRGQLFAFGVNVWETTDCRMDVDIDTRVLDYTLTTGLPQKPGCRVSVKLYNKLLPSAIAETYEDIAAWCRYVPIPVFWNGKRISKELDSEKWDYKTPEAYIRLTETGPLRVYNLGVHTCDLPNSKLGTGGIVVSLQQLKVNFARNDIQHDCPVWTKIKPFVNNKVTDRSKSKVRLTDGERSRLIAQFVTGEMDWWDFCRLKVLELVNGKCTTPNVVFTTGRTITWCKARDPIGDKLQQDGIAQVLCESVLSDFGVDSLEELAAKCQLPHHAEFTIAEFEDLAKALRSDHKLLSVKDYCPNELVWLRLMEKCGHEIVSIVKQFSDVACKKRQYMIGSSLSLAGWTDGCSWIAIAREWLMKQPFNVQGFGDVGALLLHEYIHGAPDSETHVHGPEFYEDYHNASKAISRFAYCCLSYFPQIMQSEGRKVSKRALRNLDSVAKADAALAKFGKVATAKAE